MSETEYTTKVLEFVLFCVEMYAQRGGVSGSVVMKRFDVSGALTFLRNNYEVLHTQGRDYILSEIDQYLANRGVAI
jgi:hypothetical protein